MSARFARPLALRPLPGGEASPIRTAMVLAAGLGTRMRPLTASRPKPLVEVAGKPLLDHVLDRLRVAEIERLVINVHYLADQLEAHVRTAASDFTLAVSDERELLLETGGGIAHALPLIGDDRFLVVNSDNLWLDGPADSVRLLGGRWDDARMDALLLVVPLARANCHRGPGDFQMDSLGRLSRRRYGRLAPFVFTGVQLVSRRLFETIPDGPFSMNLLWNRAIAAGRAFGMAHAGMWFDVGAPESIAKTEAMLADG